MHVVTTLMLLFSLLLAPMVYASAPAAKPPQDKPSLTMTSDLSEAAYLKAFRAWSEEKQTIQHLPQQAECTWVYVDIWGLRINFVLDIHGAGCGAGGGGGWAF